jgi:hypothetical protein
MVNIMKDSLTKLAGRGVVLHRYGTGKKGILYGALGTAAGVFLVFAALPGGNLLGDLVAGAFVGETYVLVAAAKDPDRKDTFQD